VISTKSGFYEDVSDINGITIPCIYYDYLRKNNEKDILYEIIEHGMESVKEGDHRFLKTIIQKIPQKCSEISDYLYMANVYIAVQEKLYFRLKQIGEDEYDWLTVDILKTCTQKMDEIIGDECMKDSPEAEYTMIHYNEDEEHGKIDQILTTHFPNKKFRFCARLDLVSDRSVWELKCTSELTEDHFLQVIIYAWLWKMIYDEDEQRIFRLFNIRTGEHYRLIGTENDLTDIVILILQSKYQKNVYKSNEEFLLDLSLNSQN
jgi:hypothetical protein